MISYDEALELFRSQISFDMPVEKVRLQDADGRLLAEEVTAKIDSPSFTNSAMDGIACQFADINSELAITATVFAKSSESETDKKPQKNCCVKIMTGAPLPQWCDTVIPIENCELVAESTIRVREEFVAKTIQGQHIRHKGEDLKQGSVLLREGETLSPVRLMVLAATGHESVNVYKRPKVHIISTGDELKPIGSPLEFGEIYNSSAVFLEASARKIGLTVASCTALKDDSDAFSKHLENISDESEPSLIITTGAVSAGEKDFIPKLAVELGYEKLLHKVAIRPGKPLFVAKRGKSVWVGLPGNAVSTSVGWSIFIRPLLANWAAIACEPQKIVEIQNNVEKPNKFRCFYRAEINGNKAWVPKRQGSAQLASSLHADAYVILPEGHSKIKASTKVETIHL